MGLVNKVGKSFFKRHFFVPKWGKMTKIGTHRHADFASKRLEHS